MDSRRCPSCPVCGKREGVEHLEGTYDVGTGTRAAYQDIQGREWYCGPCNVVFVGTEAEWYRGRYGEASCRDWRTNGGRRPEKPRELRSVPQEVAM